MTIIEESMDRESVPEPINIPVIKKNNDDTPKKKRVAARSRKRRLRRSCSIVCSAPRRLRNAGRALLPP